MAEVIGWAFGGDVEAAFAARTDRETPLFHSGRGARRVLSWPSGGTASYDPSEREAGKEFAGTTHARSHFSKH
jgi:hypothetical protein